MQTIERPVHKLPPFLLKLCKDPILYDGESLVQRLLNGDLDAGHTMLLNGDIKPVDCYQKKFPNNLDRGSVYLKHAHNTFWKRLVAEAAKKRGGYHPHTAKPDSRPENRTLPYYADEPLPECFQDTPMTNEV